MLVLGPIIFGFILGIIIGCKIKTSPEHDVKLTKASYLVIAIAAILMAWQLGQYPFYNDLPISTGFLSTLIGLLLGKLLFSGSKI